MTLFRAAARTMLASYFVASGVKAIRAPQDLVADAEPLVDRVVPLLKEYAPEQVADRIPDDTATLVRIQGALQLVGGLALATGKGRRLGAALLAGSLIPSTIAKYPFWSRATAEEKAADREHFLKNLSLLGGVLLASWDTEGKPSLAYRATKGGHALTRDTRKALDKGASHTRDLAENVAEGVAAGSSLLVGTAVATGRKAQKQARRQLKVAKKVAGRQLAEGRKAATVAAKQAQKASKQARKDGRKLAQNLSKEATHQLEAAKKSAAKLAENIHLGEN